MNLPSRQDRKARTGSNLLIEQRKPLPADQKSPSFVAAERAYLKERKRLLSRRDRQRAAKLAAAAKAEWYAACRKSAPEGEVRAKLKSAALKKLRNRLAREIPGAPALRALQGAWRKRRATELQRIGNSYPAVGGPGEWGVQIDPDSGIDGWVVGRAPFPAQELEASDVNDLMLQDDSRVLPRTGDILTNFTFEHDDSNWPLTVQSGATFVSHFASCGFAYRMPRTGYLLAAATFTNFYNRLAISITDNFGFSSSVVTATARLFIGIRRAGQPDNNSLYPLLASTVSSDGEKKDRTISDLDNSGPYFIASATSAPIPAGEKVTILAGFNLYLDSDTDDMTAHIHARYRWRLNELKLQLI